VSQKNKTGLSRHFVIFDIRACTLSLRAERQSAQMLKITNDGLTRSGTGCFIAVPVWHSGRQRVEASVQLLVVLIAFVLIIITQQRGTFWSDGGW